MNKKLFLGVMLAAVLASCTFSGQKKSENASAQPDSVATVADDNRQFLVKEGDLAPDFEMQFPDGKTVTLSSLRGKVVMLQFTASWCGVCRKEMPHIESQIWQRHKNNSEFVLYGIDREEPAEKIEEMVQATGITYPVGMDPAGDIFALYAERNAGITRNVIIDRDGHIVMLTRLFEEEEFNRMVKLIDELLEQ